MNSILYPATIVSLVYCPGKATVDKIIGVSLPFLKNENLQTAVPCQTQLAFAGQRESEMTESKHNLTWLSEKILLAQP
jgi:hypothetical protein